MNGRQALTRPCLTPPLTFGRFKAGYDRKARRYYVLDPHSGMTAHRDDPLSAIQLAASWQHIEEASTIVYMRDGKVIE